MNKKLNRKQNKRTKQPEIRIARSVITLILGVVFLSGAAVFASKGKDTILSFLRPDVKISLSGSVSRDDVKISVDKAGTVKTGEVINWTICSKNAGEAKASGFKTVGQIPPGTEYVAGSAKGDEAPDVEFSIDGGKSFSKKPTVTEKQADGSEKQVAAPVSMYTQVRFGWEKPLDSDHELNAFYSVRVK
ncbi:MAG: hypothetical protein R2681_04235 [Pyrinomonadaceae bacterium]